MALAGERGDHGRSRGRDARCGGHTPCPTKSARNDDKHRNVRPAHVGQAAAAQRAFVVGLQAVVGVGPGLGIAHVRAHVRSHVTGRGGRRRAAMAAT